MVRRKFMGQTFLGMAGLAAGRLKGFPFGRMGAPGVSAPSKNAGGIQERAVSPKARELHTKAIIIDGHNDSLIEHWARKESYDLGRDWPAYHADLARMKRGGLTAVNSMVGDSNLVQGLELWSAMFENLEKHPGDFLLVLSAEDIPRAKKEGKIGLIGQLEGCAMLSGNLRVLQTLHKLGVRVAGLTHGEGGGEFHLQPSRSPFGYGTPADREAARKETPGLTEFGRDVVRELNRLGIVVDLAHANDAAFHEALEISSKPVIFSHGNAFALSPHWPNLTDEQLKALAANGGVIGVVTYPAFIDQSSAKQTLQRLVDHIEHVCELVGDDHVGFGSDYDGMGSAAPVIPSYGELPWLTEAMLDRGFTESTILKFWGGNFLRVMRKAGA